MIRKKKKITKMRGSRTCGGGGASRRRGAGNRGGRGKAGLHKHKWTLTVKYGEETFFGRDGLKPRREKPPVINLSQIEEIALKKNLSEIALPNYKVLSRGNLSKPITVKAHSFSKKALEKIENAGGKAVVVSS